MSYSFMSAGQLINNKTPKQSYTDLTQATLDEQFYNASNVYTIQEETALASGLYQDVDVRITYVINTNTGERISDDFKTVLFKNITHPTSLGKMYKFNNNFWVTVNVDNVKTLYTTVTVRRCNNVLRWMDALGAIYEFPCSLGYLIKENRDYATAGSSMVVPSGMSDCVVQFNNVTNKIRPNQRFLFGNPSNWTAYRVEGGGINNFNNLYTVDNSSSGLIKFSLAVDYLNEQTDDLTRGIANAIQDTYALTLNQSSISGQAAQTVQLQATVTLNGETVVRSLEWHSANSQIATVSSTGLVTFVGLGTTTITCNLLNNDLINTSCDAETTSSPVDNYQVIYAPNVNYILEGDEKTWTVYLYKNGVQQADIFAFVLDSNTVPDTSYIYTVIGGNSFKVHNYKMFLTDYLEVTATSGSYSKVIQINLRGKW